MRISGLGFFFKTSFYRLKNVYEKWLVFVSLVSGLVEKLCSASFFFSCLLTGFAPHLASNCRMKIWSTKELKCTRGKSGKKSSIILCLMWNDCGSGSVGSYQANRIGMKGFFFTRNSQLSKAQSRFVCCSMDRDCLNSRNDDWWILINRTLMIFVSKWGNFVFAFNNGWKIFKVL